MKKPSKKKEFEKKVLEYKRFLKNDQDWDWAYILRLLQYKLERTRKCIVSNKIVASSNKIGKQIKEVEVLLSRVVEDRYYAEISKDFRKKYGALRVIVGKSEPGSLGVPVKMVYARETPRNRKMVRRESSRLHRRAVAMQRADLKKALNLIYKNLWFWWD